MPDAYERSFMSQIQSYRASGGDIDALVDMSFNCIDHVIFYDNPRTGSTRLYHASLQGWHSSVVWLLEQGANVHRVSYFIGGETPLHAAVISKRRDAVELLLDAGARVDDPDISGCTALHLAARDGLTKICKLLLSRGASLDSRERGRRDPEARAFNYNNMTTAAYGVLVKVRVAGGWTSYVAAPRLELLELRRALAALRERGRASPSSVLVHEVLFLRDDVPDDVFSHILTFWRSDRDYYTTNYPD